MKHSTYTDPITYWSYMDGDIYSQTDNSHIASCDEGEVAPGVQVPALIAAAPELLDVVRGFMGSWGATIEDDHARDRVYETAEALLNRLVGVTHE